MLLKSLVVITLCLALVSGGPARLPRNASNDGKGSRIIGGNDATDGQFPYQVSLQTASNYHYCGGSIIAPRWILSAAHCTVGMTTANVNVYVGSVARSSGGVYYSSMRIVNHPTYNPGTVENDISLIETVEPIVFNANTQPIALGSSFILSGTGATISGWGQTNKMDNDVTEVPDIMQWMTANILTMEACRAERPESNQIFDSVMCVSSPSGQGACSGDSGGPLVYNGEVHGVASFVRFPCGTEISDVYERVFAHRSWIASVTV
ncbi:chymotrypsin-2-like isoform X2 [Anopheles albimanus]|uniref:chymotrypsin-2-like isoform X2 n=1 Tax=Anopheles albimanus TaxID=7167 RepID=UPI0016404C62|nr:chymotrypsin-2-like isoform X2 [Anopheles albimanus]